MDKGIMIQEKTAHTISEFIDIIENLDFEDLQVYFRGEPMDYKDTAFQPSVYRGDNLEKEHLRYREIQRFNDLDFMHESSTLDKLSRMQHFDLPTRLIDLSEDALTSLFFAVKERQSANDSIVYVVGIDKSKVKYYDSDTVLILSNLAKLPLKSDSEKSKRELFNSTNYSLKKQKSIKWFNEENSSVGYLLHEIREDKSHLQSLINPKHIFSVQCVKPKLSNQRIYSQKGAFLIFGLNGNDVSKSIPILEFDRNQNLVLHTDSLHSLPIRRIFKIRIKPTINLDSLKKVGITEPYIYTGLEKISKYLKEI